MNPTFHLYGMKITLAGDLTAAKDRVHLARLLMFKTKLVNVNRLDIIQNNLRLDDGTHVHFMSQHGFDSATIYVPPKPVVKRPEPRERIVQIVRVVFEAFDAGGNDIGYVVCLGNGFNGPYRFVNPHTDMTDLFEWGQWLENYETRPFDDLDEYLKLKMFSGDGIDYWEIPPIGTKNRFFKCTDNESISSTGVPGTWSVVTFPKPEWEFHNCCADIPYSKTYRYSYDRMLTYSSQGEDGSTPPAATPSGYAPWDSLLVFLVNRYRETKTASGIIRYTSAVGGTYEDTIEGCPAQIATKSTDVPPPEIIRYPWSYFFAESFQGSNFEREIESGSGTYTTNSYYPNWITSASEEKNATDNFSFWENCSSVDTINRSATVYCKASWALGRSVSWAWEGPPSEGSGTKPGDIPLDETAALTAGIYVNLNGENEYKVGDYTSQEVEDGFDWDNQIRYYRLNNIEFLLCAVDVSDILDEEVAYHYAHIKKTNDSVEFDDSVVLTGSDGVALLPGVTDYDNNQVYVKNRFRLALETKVIKEQ